MNRLGKPHGALGVSDYDGVISPAYFVADIADTAEPRFIHHLLRTRLYISEYERRGKFMPPSQFDISWEDFRSIPVVMPPLAEQRGIAAYLDRETEHLDALVSAKQMMSDLLDARFDAAVFCAISGADHRQRKPSGLRWLDTIPAHWTTPPVSANFEVQLGKMLSAQASAGADQCSYLRNTNVQWDRLDLADVATMHFNEDDRRTFTLYPGDLLVCEGGEVGRAAVWRGELEECYFQKALHRIRALRAANARYLLYCLWAAAKLGVFAVEGNLSTIVHLTREQLKSHRFPWPPDPEQSVIVEHLDLLAATARSARAALASQIELLRERRQALVTAAVTGQLDIPEAA